MQIDETIFKIYMFEYCNCRKMAEFSSSGSETFSTPSTKSPNACTDPEQLCIAQPISLSSNVFQSAQLCDLQQRLKDQRIHQTMERERITNIIELRKLIAELMAVSSPEYQQKIQTLYLQRIEQKIELEAMQHKAEVKRLQSQSE